MTATTIRKRTSTVRAAACLVLSLVVGLGSLAGSETASARSSPAGAATASQPAVDPRAAAAIAIRNGISLADARARLGQEQAVAARGARVGSLLGERSGGTYLDADRRLVVTTLDARSDALVRRAGGRAQRVDDSAARLDAIVKRLDRMAAEGRAGAAQGWYVDVPTNTVVITITQGALDANTLALTKLAATFGDSVRIEYHPAGQRPQPTEWMVSGYDYVTPGGGTCSVGFNALDAYNRNVVLTAGHCLRMSGTASRNGYSIGATRTVNFPGDDFGTFWNSYPSYWQPSISVYLWNGTYADIRGQWDNPPVGAAVCKSGRTTGFTCGTITAVNETVIWDDGTVLYGLVRHNACVEEGDSGGANVSGGYYALGVTSGAKMNTYTRQCMSKSGGVNVSWYQPIGEALTRNGLRLLR